jgi:hypothetical protein
VSAPTTTTKPEKIIILKKSSSPKFFLDPPGFLVHGLGPKIFWVPKNEMTSRPKKFLGRFFFKKELFFWFSVFKTMLIMFIFLFAFGLILEQ